MARKPKQISLGELRHRHQHCITWVDINRGIRNGDWAEGNYEKHKHKVGPACSAPEDGVCAAPSVSDQVIFNALEEKDNELV